MSIAADISYQETVLDLDGCINLQELTALMSPILLLNLFRGVNCSPASSGFCYIDYKLWREE